MLILSQSLLTAIIIKQKLATLLKISINCLVTKLEKCTHWTNLNTRLMGAQIGQKFMFERKDTAIIYAKCSQLLHLDKGPGNLMY